MFNPEKWPSAENEKIEKETRFKDIEKEVDEIIDAKGKHIEPGIKDVIVGLKAWEFPTNQSCEGHIKGEKGQELYPWVEIYAPEPEGWEEDEEKKKEWTIENQKQQKKMIKMLDEFYQIKEIVPDAKLSFEPIGIYGGFRIRSTGAEAMKSLSPKEQKRKQELYRKEMNDFAKFLRDKYLQG